MESWKKDLISFVEILKTKLVSEINTLQTTISKFGEESWESRRLTFFNLCLR